MMKTIHRLGIVGSVLLLRLATAAATPDADNVIWDSPSADYHGSMPLGNGDIALNAWVERDGELRFYVSKPDAWDENARLLKIGRVRIHFEPSLWAPGQPFRQELKLGEGSVEITSGGAGSADAAAGTKPRATVRLWVDANHPVVHVTADAAIPVEVTAYVELWRTNRQEVTTLEASDIFSECPPGDSRYAKTITEPDTLLTGARERVGWYHHNAASVGPELMAKVQGLTGFKQDDPLRDRTFGAVMTAVKGERVDDLRLRSPRGINHQFNLFVLTRKPASPERWLAEMDRLIEGVEARPFAARREAHMAWWREFWERSWIHATAPAGSRSAGNAVSPPPDDTAYVSQMYQLQRFVTACAGRGAYPIKFNGSLFTVPPPDGKGDADYRRWGPGYWWQNTRLPYISLCASGDTDLMAPLFRMYAGDLLELCKYRTRLYFGHEGAFYPECIYFWGPVFSATYGWTPFEKRADKLQEGGWHKWEWVGGLELCWLMLDYYEHTLDRDFLDRTALPFTREILTFFEQHYRLNAKGQLIMHPSQALETWWECTNPMPEVAGCRAVAKRLLTLPPALASETDREFWRRLLVKMPALPLRQFAGRDALAPAAQFDQKRNVENPELYAVFPFRLVAVGRTNLDWGLAALEHREDRGNSGWRQDDIFMAYLGLAEAARSNLVARARSHDPQSRFPAFWGPNYDWTPDQDHGGVLMKAFQSMLLQTDGRKILLLPAWPKDWEVSFKLHAPYQTVLEGEYRQGQVRSLKVTPEARRADVVLPQ